MVLKNGTFASATADQLTPITVEFDMDDEHVSLDGCDIRCDGGVCEVYCGLPNTTSDEAFEFQFPDAAGSYEYPASVDWTQDGEMPTIHYGGEEAAADYPDEYSNYCLNHP